jgi:hypothetical protein
MNVHLPQTRVMRSRSDRRCAHEKNKRPEMCTALPGSPRGSTGIPSDKDIQSFESIAPERGAKVRVRIELPAGRMRARDGVFASAAPSGRVLIGPAREGRQRGAGSRVGIYAHLPHNLV